MSDVLLFPETPTRKQLAWAFARTIWGARPDFPHGKQYPSIVENLAAGFDRQQLVDAIESARQRDTTNGGGHAR